MRATSVVQGEARRGATTVVALGAVVACLLVLIVGSLKFAADRSDQDAVAHEKALARNGLLLEREAILREIKSFAVSDDTVEHTAVALDLAVVHANFGQMMFDEFRHDYSFILGSDDRPVYASLNGEIAAPRVFQRVRADIADRLAAVRAAWRENAREGAPILPATYVGYRDVEGRPALVGIVTITSDSGRMVQLADQVSLAVSFKFLDGPFGTHLSRHYLLRQFGVTAGQIADTALGAVPVPTDAGRAPFHVYWTSDQPGTRMLTQVVPVLLGGLVLIGGIAVLLVIQARRANGRLVASEQRAHTLAFRDVLTGRGNRAQFVDSLSRAMADPASGHVGVIYVDLDGFKDVNDTLGHSAGDELLRMVGDRLAALVRGHGDLVARFGGDEFAIMISNLGAPDEIAGVCRRLSAAFYKPFALSSHPVTVNAALGAAVSPDHGSTPVDLMRRADIALHQAKLCGRGAWLVFEKSFEEQMVQRRTIDQDLRLAIDNDELSIAFQPQYSVDGKQLLGFEALARWDHPTRGMIPPSEFVQIAEETGLILRLDEWMLRNATAMAADWDDLHIAVNLSPLHFRSDGGIERVRAVLAETGFPKHRLELEITESVLLHNNEAFAMLETLRADGIRLALDDFGSGYSSLAYVRRFVFDKIKIDKSFVQSLGDAAEAAAIVECVVRMGCALGATVVAEGVESHDQQRFLQACGCHVIQGFLFGRPLSPVDAEALVATHHATERPRLRVVEG